MEKPKKPEEWGVSFYLTYNAKTWTDAIYNLPLRLIPYKVTGYKTAIEIGEAGNLHSHTYVNFERSQRKSALISKLPTTDVRRVTSGTEKTVINYVGNKDKEDEKNCIIIDCWQWGDIETTQGTRTDLTATDNALWQIKEAIDSGANLRSLYNDFFPYMVRHGQGIRAYQEIVKQERYSEKIVKTKEEIEADILELERQVLKSIADKHAEGADLSRPLCQCGKPLEWNNIDRKYDDLCVECEANPV